MSGCRGRGHAAASSRPTRVLALALALTMAAAAARVPAHHEASSQAPITAIECTGGVSAAEQAGFLAAGPAGAGSTLSAAADDDDDDDI